MSKTKIILLSGKAEAGKDFCANIFKEQLEAQGKKVLITHYADLLKYICKTFFDWNGEKDEKGRTLLQHVGTDIIRNRIPNYWVKFICGIINMFENEWDYVLIPDTRFPNEVNYLKTNACGNVFHVRVIRPGHKNKLTEEQRNHISEIALDKTVADFTILNTLKDNTEHEISKIIKRIDFPEKRIYIDLDCTLYNTVKQIVDMYDEDFCYYSDYEKINWEDVRTWDFTELKAARPDQIDVYFNQKRFFDNVEMFDGAQKVINYLHSYYNIVFVSHGYSPNLRLKEEWIKYHFPYAEFIGVNLKIHSDKSCVDMSDGIFIDDKTSNLESSNAEYKICYGNIYEWNEDFKEDKINTFSARDWEEVMRCIEKIEEQDS